MNNLEVKRCRGKGYAVFNARGDRVSGHYSGQSDAERVIDHQAARQKKTRRACLCCGEEFVSVGRFNRLCRECRRKGDGTDCHLAIAL